MLSQYTVAVIGSGPAGAACAVRLAQLGARVAVVERDFVGGICTNWGCTPSKSMIESAKVARLVKESAQYGVRVNSPVVDFTQVASRRDDVIAGARQAQVDLLQHHGVVIYQGEAEVTGRGRLRVREGKLDRDGFVMRYTGEEEELTAEHIVLATGSQPLYPDTIPHDNPHVVSSNRLITIDGLPDTLTIVGGGVIGLEFATIFANLGSRVTVIEYLDRLLAGMDPEISAAITAEMARLGVTILTGHRVLAVEPGSVLAEDRAGGEVQRIPAGQVLVAVGRRPVIESAMFERLGIGYTAKGITVDDAMRSTVPGVWAIGDATGKSILAHVGIQQGIIAAENIMCEPDGPVRRMDYDAIPTAVYSIPEVAAVGRVPSPDEPDVSVFKVPFAANLRARIEAHEEGFLKIWVQGDRLLAAQAIGHNVSEIIQELANMVALRTPIGGVAEVIHAHPTYTEINRSALEYALGKPVDFYPA